MTIGVFDSGLGGLSVLKQLVHTLPEYDYLYLGDNARTPYGDRSPERIYEFTKQGVSFLFEKGCMLVILACNTASADALRKLQQEWLKTAYPDRRILGILIPVAETITKQYAGQKIGIIGTRATIQSGAYEREIIKRITPPPVLLQYACPLLVPLVEEGWQTTTPAKMIIKKYLRPLKQKQVSVLILGCTHYPFIKTTVQAIMGKRVTIIDPGVSAAHALKEYLEKHPKIKNALSQKGTISLFSTDSSERIKNLAQRFWGSPLTIERITLDS